MGQKWVYMATTGSEWSLVPKNGWTKVEQGWNRIGGIRTDHSDPLTTPLMDKFGLYGDPKMGPNESIWLLSGLNGLWCPNLAIYGVVKWSK